MADRAKAIADGRSAFFDDDKRKTKPKGQAMKKAKAFTLIEVLIVVSLLGVLAGIVIPSIANSSASAQGSALAQDLKLLRRFVLIYKIQHLEVGPGYLNGNTGADPNGQVFSDQATMASNAGGQTAEVGTPGFNRGPYLERIPVNPFNGKTTIQMLGNGGNFPADADGSHGWIYKAATSELRADNAGTDGNEKRYYDY